MKSVTDLISKIINNRGLEEQTKEMTDLAKYKMVTGLNWVTEEYFNNEENEVELLWNIRRGVVNGDVTGELPEPEEPKTPEEIVAEVVAELQGGGEVTLKQDVTIPEPLKITKATSMDLAGNTITVNEPGKDAFQFAGVEVTVKGGKIVSNTGDASAVFYLNSSKGTKLTLEEMDVQGTYPVYLNKGEGVVPQVTIKSGNYVSPYDKGVAVYVQQGGKAIIEGGYYSTNGHNSTYLLNLKDELVKGNGVDPRTFIEVRGGEFVDFDPSASMGEPGGPVSFVADGYIVGTYKDGEHTVYVVREDDGNVPGQTVRPDGKVITWPENRKKNPDAPDVEI